MNWKKIFIHLKPSVACLMTHQPVWEDLEVQSDRTAKVCKFCENYFYFPTRREEKPIYRNA